MLLAIAHARHERDTLLTSAIDMLNRHRNQKDFGLTPTLSEPEISQVAHYAQALRDVPQQKGFPHNIDWPTAPCPLRKCLTSNL